MTLPSMAPVSLLFLLLLANAAAAAAVQAAPAPPRPNLLFMMTDQQRWDTMSAVVPSLATPNMDRIAKEGVLFKWGYTSTPTCTPARAAILTGQKPWNHGSLGAVAVAHSYPFEMPTTLTRWCGFAASDPTNSPGQNKKIAHRNPRHSPPCYRYQKSLLCQYAFAQKFST